MRLRNQLYLSILLYACNSAVPTGQEVLEKSIAFHDPTGGWNDLQQKLFVRSDFVYPDSAFHDLEIGLDNPNRRVSYANTTLAQRVDFTDSSCIVAHGDRTCDQAAWTKNFYHFILGLPMTLKNDEAVVDDTVVRVSFHDIPCHRVAIDFEKEKWHFYFSQEDDHLFGLTFNESQRTASTPNRMNTFQDQEYEEETGWVKFKWRNHDPAIGRFFNIDPLAHDYVYNSPYAFSENHVTTHIELEGLEKVYIFDQAENPDNKRVYIADMYVQQDNGDVSGPFSGSSFPNNPDTHNTLNDGTHAFNNESGHSSGSEQGLNIVNSDGERVASGTDPDGDATEMTVVNVHSETSILIDLFYKLGKARTLKSDLSRSVKPTSNTYLITSTITDPF